MLRSRPHHSPSSLGRVSESPPAVVAGLGVSAGAGDWLVVKAGAGASCVGSGAGAGEGAAVGASMAWGVCVCPVAGASEAAGWEGGSSAGVTTARGVGALVGSSCVTAGVGAGEGGAVGAAVCAAASGAGGALSASADRETCRMGQHRECQG
jgi:hypothetical protein